MSDQNLNQSVRAGTNISQSAASNINSDFNQSEVPESELELDTNQLEDFISTAEKSIKDKDEMFKIWQDEVISRRKILFQRSKLLLEQKKDRLKVYEDITRPTRSPSVENDQ